MSDTDIPHEPSYFALAESILEHDYMPVFRDSLRMMLTPIFATEEQRQKVKEFVDSKTNEEIKDIMMKILPDPEDME